MQFETEQSKMYCSSGFKKEPSCNCKALPLWPKPDVHSADGGLSGPNLSFTTSNLKSCAHVDKELSYFFLLQPPDVLGLSFEHSISVF